MNNVYNENIDGKNIILTKEGEFYVNGIKSDWYKDNKTGKPWIPVKRTSFIGLVKQILRD